MFLILVGCTILILIYSEISTNVTQCFLCFPHPHPRVIIKHRSWDLRGNEEWTVNVWMHFIISPNVFSPPHLLPYV